MISDSPIEFKDNMIHVANEQYPETLGLIELLFTKTLNKLLISDIDEQNYMNIIDSANTLYKRYKHDASFISDGGLEYQNYIAKSISSPQKKMKLRRWFGKALSYCWISKKSNQAIDYVYYERLELFINHRYIIFLFI